MNAKKLFAIIGSFILFHLTIPGVFGDNPDLSLWLRNISEPNGTPPHLRALEDDASEMAISGSTIHVIWLSDSSYYKDFIFYNRLTDNGATWEWKRKLVELDHNYFAENLVSKRMAVSGDYVHIVYAQW